MNFKHLACLAAMLLTSFIARGDIVYPRDRAERNNNTTATEKLDRGVSNIIFGWEEIPRAWWYNADPQRYDGAGFCKGTFDGMRNAGVRLGQGFFDVFTFPWNTANFDLPWDPPPPKVHPEWIPGMISLFPGQERVDAWIGDGMQGDVEGQMYP